MPATTLMAIAAGTQAMSGAANAYTQSNALKAQGDYQKQQYDLNAEISDLQAKDAEARGEKASSAIEKKTKQTVGAQRASLAAQGLDPNAEGTALDLQNETETLGALDAVHAKNDAWRESLGYQIQSSDLRGRGRMSKLTADNQAKSTLITGGLQFVSGGLQAGAYAMKAGSASKTGTGAIKGSAPGNVTGGGYVDFDNIS